MITYYMFAGECRYCGSTSQVEEALEWMHVHEPEDEFRCFFRADSMEKARLDMQKALDAHKCAIGRD